MHIRFLNTYEPVNSFYRDLLPTLAEQGHQLEVLVSRSEYRPGRTPLAASLQHPNITVKQLGPGSLTSRSELHKALAQLSYIGQASLATLFGPPVDLNFFLTQPPLFGLWGALLKKLRGQPYIVLVMDLYPDVAVQNGLLPPHGWVTRLLTWFSRLALKQSTQVIAIGRCMAARLRQGGLPANRITVIPNWANLQEVFPISSVQNDLRHQLGLADKFVVLYSGNLGVSHFFDDLLIVARRLNNQPDIQFVFIGEGARRCEVEAAKTDGQLTNIILLPFQPAELLPQSLSLGDVHFVSLRPGFEGLVVPSKTYGILAAGRPVIFQGEPNTEIGLMVAEEGVGRIVNCHDPHGLEQAILTYYQQPELVQQQGRRARSVAATVYSRQHGVDQYCQLIHRLAAQPNLPLAVKEQL